MQALPHTHHCFVCGLYNPSGLKLDFETDGTRVWTRFVPRAEHVGFKATLHGGIVATVLDEVMVWACGVQTKQFAYCAELTVRYVEPVRPGVEVVAWGDLTLNRRNRLFETVGQITMPDGRILAKASGKYIPIDAKETADLLADFVGDTSAIH